MSASSDGVVTVTQDVTWASVKVVIDWQTASPMPWQTTVIRTNPDGSTVTVRSGDLAYSPGGDVYVYDHEAPIEGTLLYQAFGYSYLGVLVQTSTFATLALGTTSKTAWLKSTTNPSLSRKVSVTDESEDWGQPEVHFRIPGRPDPIIWSDVQSFATGMLVVKTKTAAAYRDLRILAGSGICLLQGSAVDHAYDHDMFIKISQATPKRPPAMAGFGLRFYSLPFTEVARPATTGSPLLVPNWTNDIVAATYATYTALDAAYSSSYVNLAKGP